MSLFSSLSLASGILGPQTLRRHRLFWKILLAFWITVILLIECLWLYVAIVGHDHHPFDRYYRLSVAPTQLETLSWVIRTEGIDQARDLLAQWPEGAQAAVRLTDLTSARTLTPARTATTITSPYAPTSPSQPSAAGSPDSSRATSSDEAKDRLLVQRVTDDVILDRTVTSANGHSIHIQLFQLKHSLNPSHRPAPWDIPREILVTAALGGLLFSAVLAWYLARPINLLRNGFSRLAAGDLNIRLRTTMGRRRDELADLAASFDVMASRLQALIAARDQLLHDVSHELRSPLARLHMAVGLARQSPHKTESSLDRIEAEGTRLDDLVGELLTLSRVEAGSRTDDGYFDALDLIRSVVDDARYEAQLSTVSVVATLDDEDDLPPSSQPDGGSGITVHGNAKLIRRAVENVVRNALRFSPPGGTVEIDAFLKSAPLSPTGRSLFITVRDQGPGVCAEDQERVFDPFVRGADSRQNTGFGLGLSIARRTIEAHGGSIDAQNNPDGGLCVTLRLPV